MMQTLQTTPLVFPVMPAASLADLQLDNDQIVTLRICISEFRAAQSRIANDYVILSAKLAMMKDILGDRFMPFAQRELELTPRTIKRYLQLHEIMTKRLSSNGRIDLVEAQQFTQGALRLLSPVTDDDIIEEVRGLARDGKTVNDEVVSRIIASRDVDWEARLKLAESETAAATRQLEEERQHRQMAAAQSQNHISRQEEIIRRTQEQAKAFEDEIQRLEKQATVVSVVDKEVVPAGYQSVQEAIAAAREQLTEAQARAHTAQQEAEAAEQIAGDLQNRLTAFSAETQDFMRVKSVVEEAMALAPQAQLQSLASKDPNVKKALLAMGAALVQFGQSLQTTAGRAA